MNLGDDTVRGTQRSQSYRAAQSGAPVGEGSPPLDGVNVLGDSGLNAERALPPSAGASPTLEPPAAASASLASTTAKAPLVERHSAGAGVGSASSASYNEDEEEELNRRGSHRYGAVGNLLLWWNFGLLRYGWSHTLVSGDLPALKARYGAPSQMAHPLHRSPLFFPAQRGACVIPSLTHVRCVTSVRGSEIAAAFRSAPQPPASRRPFVHTRLGLRGVLLAVRMPGALQLPLTHAPPIPIPSPERSGTGRTGSEHPRMRSGPPRSRRTRRIHRSQRRWSECSGRNSGGGISSA